jgi:pyruvate kinase
MSIEKGDAVTISDGKPVLRAGTIVPAVMIQCSVCHGVKEGQLLGVIVYDVPIK